jgi:hypothetical protein
MNLRKLFIVLSVFLFLSYTAHGQIVPADRATVWNPGLNAVGGIPARTTIYIEIEPSGGDDCPIIQEALNKCPEGQVVLLKPGTFNINGDGLKINRSNITLRGSGISKTRLIKPLGTYSPVITIGTQNAKFMNRSLLASNVSKGSYQVTLATNHGFTVDEIVAINQRPDPDFVNWGCHAIEGQDSRCWFNDCNASEDPMGRPLGQVLEIKSISGNTLTFSTPIHLDYKVSLGARLAKIGNGTNTIPTVKYSGVEDLYVAYGEGGDGGGNIALFAAAYCWVKNVESEKSNGSNINIASSFRCVLRDSYVHSTVNPTPGGAGYGINLGIYSADNLIENNISWNFNKVMVMRAAGGGNVIGYNYMDDGWGAYYPTQPEAGINASHYAASNFELFEGNESFCFSSEAFWGNEAYITIFRNHLSSLRGAHGFSNYKYLINEGKINECTLYYEDIQERKAVSISAGSYYFTFIGNVLGFDGMSIIPKRTPCIGQESKGFIYEIISPGGAGDGEYVPMWRLDVGMDQLTCNNADKNTKDNKVASTLLRDGNYDFFTKTIKWDRTAQTIPNSLYLNSKPSFFGSQAWPWVTPENNSKPLQGILPAKARFDSIFYGTETAPVISTTTNGNHCGAGSIKLGATANRGTINWYENSTGGASIGSGLSFTTPNLSSSKIYYVDATENGKTTPIRTAVHATIAANPIITSIIHGQNCGSGNVTLKATTDGDKIRWYDVPNGGNSLWEGNSFTSPVLTATKTYYIEAINYYCTSPIRKEVIATINTNCTTDVENLQPENSLIIYPNPVSEFLYFKSESPENLCISIFNLSGTKVWSGEVKEQKVNVSQLPAGVYLLQISKDKEIQTIRFIKQ